MSANDFSAQELASFYMNAYSGNAASALVLYDWLLCLSQEVTLIWCSGLHPKVTAAPVVYLVSRYSLLVQNVLVIATNYPMSDLSCRANAWAQIISRMLATISFGVFSALRAYALSNRNIYLAVIVNILVLPPSVMAILQDVYADPKNLPSPFNCSPSVTLSQTLSTSVTIVSRGSQIIAELLVVGITWWYAYQSYRIRRGVNLGTTVSSLLLYNGSLYFLFLLILYIVDIILKMASLSGEISTGRVFVATFYDPFLVQFYDVATSILACRFILSLRQFDNTVALATLSLQDNQYQGHGPRSTSLRFAVHSSNSLPPFIASFAHPVHVDLDLYETDVDIEPGDEDPGRLKCSSDDHDR